MYAAPMVPGISTGGTVIDEDSMVFTLLESDFSGKAVECFGAKYDSDSDTYGADDKQFFSGVTGINYSGDTGINDNRGMPAAFAGRPE